MSNATGREVEEEPKISEYGTVQHVQTTVCISCLATCGDEHMEDERQEQTHSRTPILNGCVGASCHSWLALLAPELPEREPALDQDDLRTC